MVVTFRSSISASTRPASNVRSSTTVAPVHQASSGWMFQPPAWNCGSTASTTSRLPISAVRERERLVQKQFAWLSTTALGSASVPEVKTISSGSSSRTVSPVLPVSSSSRSGAGGPDSTPVRPSAADGGGTARRAAASMATAENSSSTNSSAGSASASWAASSRAESRQDSGTRTSPALAQAKKATTWSALLPVTVAIRSPRR